MPLKIGFTGTQKGMTFDQKNNFLVTLKELNEEYHLEEFHHGDCLGADKDAHDLVEIYFPNVMIHIHPPENEYKRAFCKGGFEHQALPYLVRNHKIVDLTDMLIATPNGENETQRGGTWATVRYAKKINKDVTIIGPDGNTI
jgi:hypothetical protein